MIQITNLSQRGNVPLRIARGHFATNHSHINYYIDITYQKTRLSEAKAVAKRLVTHFASSTVVDTSCAWTELRLLEPVWRMS